MLPSDVAGSLEGTWTISSASLESIAINGEDFTIFFQDLFQDLLDLGFVTQAEVDESINLFESEIEGDFTDEFEGMLTFNANGTYTIADSEGMDTGMWNLKNGDKTLVIDEGTEFEVEIDIVSLTNSRFEGSITESDNSEDIDEDGTDDELEIVLNLIFTK